LTYRKRNQMLSKIPVARPTYPLIGTNLAIAGKSIMEMLKYGERTCLELGPVWRFDMTPFFSAVIVSDLKVLNELLLSKTLTTKGVEYDFLHDWLGDGLIVANGQKWHQRRKIITPAFHFKILENFVAIMEFHGDTLIKILKQREGEKVDVFPLCGLFALDVICGESRCIFNSRSQPEMLVARICNGPESQCAS
jgi:cytochrome P450 family 4